MAPHSSTLAWKIPWIEGPGWLRSMGSLSQIQLSDFTFTFHFHALEKAMATHSSVLAWRIPGTEVPSGLPSMGSHRVRHDWSDLAAAAAAEGYGNQDWPIHSSILAWRFPLTKKPGRPQSSGSERVGHDWSDPVDIDTKLFLPVVALPQWELSMRVVQLLGLQGPWQHQKCRDTDCLCHRSYGPMRVFYQASCSWQSEGLFDQSFSVAPPIQALTGLPCLGSFSVVQRIRHIEGTPVPAWGPTL